MLYKAVFLFGVLNNVVHEEVIAWVLWFALLASVAALQSIIAYKLKYVKFFMILRKNSDVGISDNRKSHLYFLLAS